MLSSFQFPTRKCNDLMVINMLMWEGGGHANFYLCNILWLFLHIFKNNFLC